MKMNEMKLRLADTFLQWAYKLMNATPESFMAHIHNELFPKEEPEPECLMPVNSHITRQDPRISFGFPSKQNSIRLVLPNRIGR